MEAVAYLLPHLAQAFQSELHRQRKYINVDFELPGPIPVVWERTYYSDAAVDGPLGFSKFQRGQERLPSVSMAECERPFLQLPYSQIVTVVPVYSNGPSTAASL